MTEQLGEAYVFVALILLLGGIFTIATAGSLIGDYIIYRLLITQGWDKDQPMLQIDEALEPIHCRAIFDVPALVDCEWDLLGFRRRLTQFRMERQACVVTDTRVYYVSMSAGLFGAGQHSISIPLNRIIQVNTRASSYWDAYYRITTVDIDTLNSKKIELSVRGVSNVAQFMSSLQHQRSTMGVKHRSD